MQFKGENFHSKTKEANSGHWKEYALFPGEAIIGMFGILDNFYDWEKQNYGQTNFKTFGFIIGAKL